MSDRIDIQLDEMRASVNKLMQTRSGMHDDLNDLNAKMDAIRGMVSKRLQSDMDFFARVRGEIIKEFEELDRLKAELDAAIADFRKADEGGLK